MCGEKSSEAWDYKMTRNTESPNTVRTNWHSSDHRYLYGSVLSGTVIVFIVSVI